MAPTMTISDQCKLFKEFIMQRKEDILEAFTCIIHDSLANQPTRQLHQNQDGLGLTLPEFNNFLSLSAFSSLHLPSSLSLSDGLRIYRCENVAGLQGSAGKHGGLGFFKFSHAADARMHVCVYVSPCVYMFSTIIKNRCVSKFL
jgi:hypothetical protein